jgi:2',3'-cyclic-nucleotide 2'-phosphodiesterase (5'-nucleotidase family)
LAELSRAIAQFTSSTDDITNKKGGKLIAKASNSPRPLSRFLHIVHFNDVYNLDMSYEEEPRGGARKFASQVKAYRQELASRGFGRPLVLFSGDFVGPSLMSSLTQGAHLIAALNAIGTG